MLDLAKIKALRIKLGLSQQAAADAAGMTSRQHWYQIETGRRRPRYETLERIAAVLGVRPKDLME